MSGTNDTINSVPGLSTLVRPRFGPGMLLQHEDLEELTGYSRELNRLLLRSLFGCGVVCGLVVETSEKCGKGYILVGAGVAIDCAGDLIHVPKDQKVAIDEHCDPELKAPLWVVLCRTSKCCAPRTSMCADDDTTSMCTREREGYEIRVMRKAPTCACGCSEPNEKKYHYDDDCWCVDPMLPCYEDHYAGKCGCTCQECAGGRCDCDCVLLARLDREQDDKKNDVWVADHRVRRFVRPVLMRDPQVYLEETARAQKKSGEEKTLKEKEAAAKKEKAAVERELMAEIKRSRTKP